jgi:cobalt/nickel transport system ATP-binding protein
MIELAGVELTWPGGRPLFRELSLEIGAGEKVVLLCANGSGKSTLFKLLNGLVFPTAGELRYRETAVTRAALRNRGWSRRFRQETVLLFQHPEAMLFNPTVRDEIAYGPRQLGLPDVEQRVKRWARELGLTKLLNKPPFALSGGEKQRLALATVLVLEPVCLLLDEPTASLDPRRAGWLVDFLIDAAATVVVGTHNLRRPPSSAAAA